jgi:dTDP-glucose pyrophosphorylase
MRYGSIPAGGLGSRLGPTGFSKELLPVGECAAIDHLIERMLLGGIDRVFVNTAVDKQDLVRYLAGQSRFGRHCVFLVRERRGLFDGVVQPAQFLRDDDELYFGLPDTIWFPREAFQAIVAHPGALVLGLFDSGTPERFDAVSTTDGGRIDAIDVKVPNPPTKWTWGIGKLRVSEVARLREFAAARDEDARFGDIMHDYAQTFPAYAVRFEDSAYLDVGTRGDYARASSFLANGGRCPAVT